MRTWPISHLAAAAVAFVLAQAAHAQSSIRHQINIAAKPVASALKDLAAQTGVQVLVFSEDAGAKQALAVEGHLTYEEALNQLLRDSGLTYRKIDDNTVVIREKTSQGTRAAAMSYSSDSVRLAQASNPENTGSGKEAGNSSPSEGQGEDAKEHPVGESQEEEDPERSGIPEILVTGSKLGTLNSDIRRSEDDIQPYIVFDRETIERSSAANLEEFFKNELTVSASALAGNQYELGGNTSEINLRGLGADETLILIDGRRVAGLNFEGTPRQSDINGIPLAAIERIEVLPTTASGIFGGGATGGAINIVLRRDYSGFASQLTYGNTLKSDATNRRVDLNGGFNFEGGRTHVLLSGSYSNSNPLLVDERQFVQRGRQHVLDANGGSFEALNQFGIIPPLGATANIGSLGGNLTLDSEFGGTDLGTSIAYVPVGYPGLEAAGDGGAALVQNAGRYNLDLGSTAQQGGGKYALLSGSEVKSVMIATRREFTPKIQAFLELQGFESSTEYSANFADLTAIISGNAPNNPFQQSIIVRVPTIGIDEAVLSESQSRRAVFGIITALASDWQLATDFTWSRSRFSYVWPRRLSSSSQLAANNGSLDVLRDLNQYPIDWERDPAIFQPPADMVLKNTAIRLAGPLPGRLPGGNANFSFLAEHRDELLDEVIRGSTLFPSRSQAVSSVYLETRLPFVSQRNKKPALELLELQVALRGDDYRVTGANLVNLNAPMPIENFTTRSSSVDPTIGLRYQPTPDVTFRFSYGTGYLPPSITQLVPSLPFPRNIGWAGLTDPLRGDEPISRIEWTQGGNSNLVAEQSDSRSIGLIVTPRALEGLRIAADWSQITKTDNIEFAFNDDQASLETFINYFPERIIRGEPSDGFSVGPITGIDATLVNIARLKVEALDLAVDYQTEVRRFGVLGFSADATRLFSRESQAAPGAEVVENVGVLVNVADSALKWKARASVTWHHQEWTLGWRTRFFDSYFFDVARTISPQQGAGSVPSQIYHDFFGGYRLAPSSESIFKVLANTEVSLGVNNVFDKEPPIDVVRAGTLMYSSLGDPRLANYYMTVRKSFGR